MARRISNVVYTSIDIIPGRVKNHLRHTPVPAPCPFPHHLTPFYHVQTQILSSLELGPLALHLALLFHGLRFFKI